MCEYCHYTNQEDSFEGCEGVYYDKLKNKYYFVIEHFRNERNKAEVHFCPMCGVKLNKGKNND